jgi:uncharacterized DUF497 family protein
MHFEWNRDKADHNLRKHGVSFEEASTVFFDSLAVAGRDPDHSLDESRYVVFGQSLAGRLLVVARREPIAFASLVPGRRLAQKGSSMKKDDPEYEDDLRTEYKRSDFSELVRGRYAERLKEGSNIVVLDPRVAQAFPNSEAVNEALLSLLELTEKTARLTRR